MLFTPEIIEKYKNSDSKLQNYYYYNARSIDHKIVGSLVRSSCAEKIGSGYLEYSRSQVMRNENFDMIAIFTEAKQTKKTVAGFIIMQKGECLKMPNTYSVNVVCSKYNRGKILLGLALYAIKNNPTVKNKQCILEVATGHLNFSAYCVYSKFGFVADTKLYGKDCFYDYGNLPMIIDTNNITNESIISTATTSTAGKDALCTISRSKQMHLGVAMKLKVLNETGKLKGEYAVLKNTLDDNGVSIDELIEMIKTKPISHFNHLFSRTHFIPRYGNVDISSSSSSSKSDFTLSDNYPYTKRTPSPAMGKATRRRNTLRLKKTALKTANALLSVFISSKNPGLSKTALLGSRDLSVQ